MEQKIAKLDKYELEIWNWGLKKGFSKEMLSKALSWAKLSSMERFIASFLREDVNDLSLNFVLKGSNKERIVEIKFKSNEYKSLILPVKKEFPLRRFYLSGFPKLKTEADLVKITYLPQLFDLFRKSGNKYKGHWGILRKDFLLSNAYLFMAVLLREQAKSKLKKSKLENIYKGKAFSGDELLTFFEEWAINGHLLHPTPKSKLGFSLEDLEKFSPESQSEYLLDFGALKKDKAYFLSSHEKTFDEFLKGLSPKFHNKAVRSIKKLGLDPEGYYVIPIHPWQYQNFLEKKIQKELKKNDFVLIPKLKVKAKPLIAFRTVYSSSLNVYLKLPLNVQITSAIRTLSSKPCHNGVVLSRIFENLKNKRILPDSFEFQKEIASIRLKENYPFYKNLSVIIRENCSRYTNRKDLLLPAATLFEDSLLNDKKKIIDDILGFYLKSQRKNKRGTSILKFFESYLDLLLVPSLTLLTKYGIGIEAHLQNSIVVFSNFCPYKFIYRDHDAVSVCLKRLRRHFPGVKFYPRSWNVSWKRHYAQDKLMHSLFHSHIAELINHLDLNYGLNWLILWKLVAKRVYLFLRNATRDSIYGSRAFEDLEYFFDKETGLKSLLKMKLKNRTKKYIYTSAENPMFKALNVYKKST